MDLDRLKANVFPGESGGDYSALFGYSNRPGGQFEGVNLTDMTVDEALQFANPSGPYGQWVKGQVGRVATPMGAFQVVGSTLRAAKEGLGLTGKERMTPETQDRIGQWIYQTQGPSAWEAWGKGGNMQPQGLLGMMSTRNAPDQEQLPFFQRPQTQDLLDRLAIGFGGMTLRPNQGLIQAAQERIGARREERQTTAQLNKTLEYLRSEAAANPAAAQALRYAEATGDVSGALKLAQARPEQTALMQNYEFFLQQGMSPEQALQAVRSGSVVNVMPGGDKMADTFGAAVPGILEAGSQAQRSMIELAELEKLLAASPQGAAGGLVLFASNLGLDVAGASELQAAQALINRLVPQQRQPGSGPMSDADLELFKQSLPRIINQPGGNQLIINTIRKIAEYDKARADIVAQGLQEGKSPTQLMLDVYQLADPLADVRGAFGGEAPAAGGGGAPTVRTYNPDTQRLE